jgi:hypothetical protein
LARRDLTGAVDFGYLEEFAAGDLGVVEEVLALFRQQAEMWSGMLADDFAHWRDAVHTIKGAARGVGAFALGEACALAEIHGIARLADVRHALAVALADISAYEHELALRSLRMPKP